ncbi:hypothetical protein F5Y14DRAFT_444120 [Nemania sp. NC0429]|nr:hypothetical protein F5Y14DRAFT_444120 [Nemania sp. NC0429]
MATPAHLEPSKLGTKEYWDALYTTELANHAHDPSDTGTAWFDDSDASDKIVTFLSDVSRAGLPGVGVDADVDVDVNVETTSFLDLGTGNGALLFALRDDGWAGPMLGVDYSPQSVRFARRIERARRKGERSTGGDDGDDEGQGETIAEEEEQEQEEAEEEVDVHFAEYDILHDPATALLDARFSPSAPAGWDVVLDKGTFDAVSLSAETLLDQAATDTSAGPRPRRLNEAYGSRILPLVREGGLFLVTSCNWTEAELRSWFEDGAVQEVPAAPFTSTSTSTSASSSEQQQNNEKTSSWGFEAVGRIEYRSFSFGGVKGQTISTLCFRKRLRVRS